MIIESWLLYALWAAFFGGMYSFTLKVIAERWYNPAKVNLINYSIGSVSTWAYLVYSLDHINLDTSFVLWTIFFAWVNAIFHTLSVFTRVDWLRNIDTVIFFPTLKTLGAILTVWVSYFYYHESLNVMQSLGIIIGLLVPVLLITKQEHEIQRNLCYWIWCIVLTVMLSTISMIWIKEFVSRGLWLEVFMFASYVFWIIATFAAWFFQKEKQQVYKSKGIVKFSIITFIYNIAMFICFINAMKGNLAIVYTINSFSLIIPIILSIIFYKDHFNYKKIFGIVLSIISVLLFV